MEILHQNYTVQGMNSENLGFDYKLTPIISQQWPGLSLWIPQNLGSMKVKEGTLNLK